MPVLNKMNIIKALHSILQKDRNPAVGEAYSLTQLSRSESVIFLSFMAF
jgi:hypothetical protein